MVIKGKFRSDVTQLGEYYARDQTRITSYFWFAILPDILSDLLLAKIVFHAFCLQISTIFIADITRHILSKMLFILLGLPDCQIYYFQLKIELEVSCLQDCQMFLLDVIPVLTRAIF